MEKQHNTFNADLGLIILRVSTGMLMLFHGIAKLSHGHDYIRELLVEKGLPKFFWLGVPLTEVLAPVLLILGVFSRISGLGIALVMVFSIVLAHPSDAFTLSDFGTVSIELNLLYLATGLALFFTGGGRYSLYRTSRPCFQ